MRTPLPIVIDTETTGVNTDYASVIQLGAVMAHITHEDEQSCILLNTLCQPDTEIEKGAQEVHGISADDLIYAPPVDYALNTLGLQLTSLSVTHEIVLVGHNAERFDIPLMHRQAPTAGFHNYKTIDTYTAALRMFPAMPQKLGELYEWYVGKTPTNAHDAVADCLMCVEILAKMLREKDMDELEFSDWLAEPQILTVMPFGKHKGLDIDDVPHSYWRWARTNMTDVHKDVEATICKMVGCE